MASTAETLAVTRELTIEARPDTVWEFLVDPLKAALWMGQKVEFDLRPGGLYRVEVLSGNVSRGEFVEIDPPHRLVYTFGWEPDEDPPFGMGPGSSRVEVELTPVGDGTHIRFVHSGLPTEESALRHGEGWDHYLGRLVIAAGGGDPGRDPWLETTPEQRR